jgi:hypothetical protein
MSLAQKPLASYHINSFIRNVMFPVHSLCNSGNVTHALNLGTFCMLGIYELICMCIAGSRFARLEECGPGK